MPIYEYKCKDCKKTFIVHETFKDHDKRRKHVCSHCGSKKVEQLYTGVSVITSKKS